MEYEVQRCTRRCAVSQREFREGEWFYSLIITDGGDLVRRDVSPECWSGPPENSLAWWKAQLPPREQPKVRLAPNEVLLRYFHQLEGQRDKADVAYVLALLLVRRRVFRLESSQRNEAGDEILVLYCPRDEVTYQVPVRMPEDDRVESIQQHLAQLLYAGSG